MEMIIPGSVKTGMGSKFTSHMKYFTTFSFILLSINSFTVLS